MTGMCEGCFGGLKIFDSRIVFLSEDILASIFGGGLSEVGIVLGVI